MFLEYLRWFIVNKCKVWKEKNTFKFEAKHFFRGQNWGQANFWSQAKNLFGANFGAKIEARPILGPSQTNGARPGFIVCPSKYSTNGEDLISIQMQKNGCEHCKKLCWGPSLFLTHSIISFHIPLIKLLHRILAIPSLLVSVFSFCMYMQYKKSNFYKICTVFYKNTFIASRECAVS